MRYVILILSTFIFASNASAEQVLKNIGWLDANIISGEVVAPNADYDLHQLRIQNNQNEKKTFPILTISEPCVTTATYALTGQVKYENVEGAGFLEMWSHFPDGGMYFSRTSGDSGPMQSITGSSGWRTFTLPFYIGEATMRPSKLEINVVLPGQGTVYLGPIKLVQFDKGQSPIAGAGFNANGWWSNRTAGFVGGITGSVIGILGGVIGILAGIGIARKLCLFLLGAMVVFGAAALILGLTSLALSQPYAVYYPLLLGGILCMILPLVLFGTIKQRYEQIELRKMQAMDMK